MFESDMSQIRKTRFLAMLSISAAIVALGLSTLKSFALNRWAANRDNVACVPTTGEYTHPIVYRQSFDHPVENDAMVKTFVEQYIHLTLDESAVNYYSLTTADRYDKAKLSRNKWQAIELTTGLERQNAMRAYGDSNELYRLIAETGVGWKFLIDEIQISGIPERGPILAVVRGQYQITYDKAKIDLPHKLWGYKEIRLNIIQGIPTKDSKGNYLNKTGLFVFWSQQEDVSAENHEKLTQQSSDLYLKHDQEN